MYCSECGTKNKEDDLFCGECGNQLEKKIKRVRKKFEKKTKILIGATVGIIIFLWASISILLYMTSPKRIAEQYMKALAGNNINKLYSYLELNGDKTFISKEIYKELFLTETRIENYRITDIDYGTEKLTASVTVTYIEKNKTQEKTMGISLAKQKKKILLFFDNWKIYGSQMKDKIVEDFKIVVPKNAKITYAGVEVKSNYLDKNASTDTTDIYMLNQVFGVKTKVIVELENGYKIEDEIVPTNYKNTYTAKVSLSTFSKEEQDNVIALIKNDLTILYEGAINNKAFQELKGFNIEKKETIENKYNELKTNLQNSYNTLVTIKFTNITLSSVKLDENGNLDFRFKTSYQYTIHYQDSNSETQTKSSQSYTYMNLSYSVKNKTYYIVDANNLEEHFSRY